MLLELSSKMLGMTSREVSFYEAQRIRTAGHRPARLSYSILQVPARMLATVIITTLASLAVVLTVRRWHRAWWGRRLVRWGLLALPVMIFAGSLLRNAGLGRLVRDFRSPGATTAGAVLGGSGSVLLLALFFTVPAATLLRGILSLALRPRRTAAAEPGGDEAPVASPPKPAGDVLTRRTLLEGAVASVPVAGLGFGAAGIAGGFSATAVVPRPMYFERLADPLAGLKILQLTDVHLGAFMGPDGVDRIVDTARAARPDLVVLTGDFSDHLPWLEAALRSVASLDPRLGIYAVMGNHEHYRGALATRRIYAKTRIEVLDDAHRVVEVGGAKLVVAGVDDPSGHGHARAHYPRAADRALSGAPSDAFVLTLCHRPSGFPALAERGVDLTLSGHTHGAQIGFRERSLFEPIASRSYLWGRYEIAGKQLYTSSGAGHWLAFRLECPSEAALITLERA
jgi:hypothetical protein